jgi:hypothetical protein
MIYPTPPQNLHNQFNFKPISVAKIVKSNSSDSFVYVLTINRNCIWFSSKNVNFHFAKFTTEDYMSHFSGKLKNSHFRNSNLKNRFPVSLRSITSRGSYVFERPPFANTFRYQSMKAYSASKTSRSPIEFTVWFPWSIYVFPSSDLSFDSSYYPFDDPYIYFSSSKLNSLDQKVFPAALPNIYGDARVCMGASKDMIIQDWNLLSKNSTPTYSDAFNIATNHFFSGGWNNDILPSNTIPKVMMYKNSYLTSQEAKIKNHEYSSRISSPSSRSQFLNYLKIWSSMTLEEVIEAYDNDDYNPDSYLHLDETFHFKNTVYSSINNLYSYDYRDPSEKLIYSKSIFHYLFQDSPIDGHTESPDDIFPQEHYYKMLDDLISHYESNDSSSNNKFIEEPF